VVAAVRLRARRSTSAQHVCLGLRSSDMASDMAKFGSGQYVNFTGEGGAERAAYPPQTYARLAEVKRRYDPDNVFRFNQNIPPAPEN
jgi:Berberine and berberine like